MRRLLRILRAIIAILPTPVGYAIAGLLGNLSYRYAKTSRTICIANMRHVLGPNVSEARLARTVRAVFRNNVRNYYELCRLPRLPLARVLQMTRVREEQWERLIGPVRQGLAWSRRGQGSWYLPPCFFLAGWPLACSARRRKSQPLRLAWCKVFIRKWPSLMGSR